MLRAIITGAPGSGKGTISRMIVERFQLKHVSSGDLLRLHLSPDNPKITAGQLVSDSLVESLVLPELQIDGEHKGWLLDGFPRTLPQAQSLLKQEEVNMMINLQVPDDTIIQRLGGRWVHMPSGRTYHTTFNPPHVGGMDDQTGELLEQRADDRPEVVRQRLNVYHSHIRDILTFYDHLGIMFTYHGTESKQIWPHVEKHIETYLKQSTS